MYKLSIAAILAITTDASYYRPKYKAYTGDNDYKNPRYVSRKAAY